MIIELEEYPISAVFFDLRIETKAAVRRRLSRIWSTPGGEQSAVMSSSVYEIRAAHAPRQRPCQDY
jgi:hypothetical protein